MVHNFFQVVKAYINGTAQIVKDAVDGYARANSDVVNTGQNMADVMSQNR